MPDDAATDEAAPPSALGELRFVGPLAGFPEATTFALVELDPGSALLSLRSLEDADLRFLVVPPAVSYPDYAPEIDDEWVARLALGTAEDALLLVVVTPGESLRDSTVNLLAPVVVNTRTGRAAQIVLSDPAQPLRAPLVPTTTP